MGANSATLAGFVPVKWLGRLKRLWRVEGGQATAEYAILTFWTVIIALATFEAVRYALLDFYYDIASLLSLPIP